MPDQITPTEALYGAAYRVVFERIHPDNCITDDEWMVATSIASSLYTWARDLDQPLRGAYERAIASTLGRAAERLENSRRAFYMAALYETIVKPPL